MSSFGTNTRMQTFAPLINCVIDDVLSQAMPHIKDTASVHPGHEHLSGRPLLHFAPYLVVHWVKIWTVGGHSSGAMNAGVSCSRRLIVSRARCAGAVYCCKMKKSPEISCTTGSSCEKHMTIIYAIDLHCRIDENQLRLPQL